MHSTQSYDLRSFHKSLAQAKRITGQTYDQIAEKCGFTKSYISQIEKDTVKVNEKTALKIASCFNLNLESFLLLSVDVSNLSNIDKDIAKFATSNQEIIKLYLFASSHLNKQLNNLASVAAMK